MQALNFKELLNWFNEFNGQYVKLSKELIIFLDLDFNEAIRDESLTVTFFQSSSIIHNHKKSYYHACSNKTCNNIAIENNIKKLSKCKKCCEYVIPKKVLKVILDLGTLPNTVGVTAFGEVAESVLEFLHTFEEIFYFRIKKTSSFYQVNFICILKVALYIFKHFILIKG